MAFPASGLFVATFVDALDTTQLALDLDLETHKVALYTNTGTYDLTVDVGYSSPWVANEVTGTNYTAGGIVVTGTTYLHVATGLCAWDCTDPVFTNVTIAAIRGAMYYADALAGNNGICAQTFGADFPVTAGNFTIQENASGVFTKDYLP